MSENPLKKEYKLKQHLDSDHVEILDFPKTVSRFDRLLGFLASPAKDPVEATIGNDLSIVFHVSLLVGVPILSLITIFIATL
ncbi:MULTISPECIES: hypothetical protein [Bacillus]|uniref:Uncharacterized protein n=1 Tax=Bacillus pseudomycoides TaxID=64104 RepID=A0A1Y3MBJ2_9BACI|nr:MULTISPECIES: hypothetical protein [Bacillus cereus group]EOP49687.1 hypothetical protein IIW_03394 [Bacillus cereus VD136]EOP65441.1 hypothetical protein KOW_02125 [Bacillus cereus VDM006]EOQ02288.1 hypothetical protein KOY_02277 [Bacillus cereus VDM021]OOG91195.1 hypothetical protein BTH41_01698 [Bacillus mycoides]MDF2085289.1 hypothetical protein [Bacillus pseudomycoides]